MKHTKWWRATALALMSLVAQPAFGLVYTSQWQQWQTGLEVGEFVITVPPEDIKDLATKYDFTVVRFSPRVFQMDLLMASQHGAPKRASAWATEHEMTCVINAGLYQANHETHTSYMRRGSHINHGRLTKDKSMLEAQGKHWMHAPFRISDSECDTFVTGPIDANYKVQVQNIRALSCKGNNVWRQSPKKWSMTLFATDKHGNGLFIFAKEPRSVHDAINQLTQLPLDLKRAMYLEGAHVATLYCQQGTDKVLKRVGNFRGPRGVFETNHGNWQLPNMLGIKKPQ